MPAPKMFMVERASRQLNSGCVPDVVVRNLVSVGLGEQEARRLVNDLASGKLRVKTQVPEREQLSSALLGLFNADTVTGLVFLGLGILIMATLVHRHVIFLSGFRIGGLMIVFGLWRTCVGIMKHE